MQRSLPSLARVLHYLKRSTVLAALAAASPGALAAGAAQQVAGTFGTWDADLMNLENVPQTGRGVYVAVLDTGLVPNWRDYFPEAQIATHLGTGFDQSVAFKAHNTDPCGFDVEVGPLRQTTWVGSTGSSHGTHVTSTILGYDYRSNSDAAAGFPLPPVHVEGIAPEVTIIPVKVLADYNVPALPKCGTGVARSKSVFGTSAMVAAGIDYVTALAQAGYRPMVINMSLGGPELEQVERAAIDRAIAAGVILVASAGNEGEDGMGYPGGYAPVISVGSVGWTGEWLFPGAGPRYRMWWLQYPYAPLVPGSGDVPEPTAPGLVYLSDFSSRALAGQQLDVLAPGSWLRGPFPGDPGYNHLPWWSKGLGDLNGGKGFNFFFVGGTSMASPHTAGVVACMLQKNPSLNQAQVENLLRTSAMPLPPVGSRSIFDFDHAATVAWDTDCKGSPCDPVGAGVVRADAAVQSVP